MNAHDYLNSLDIDFGARSTLFSIMYNLPRNIGSAMYNKKSRKRLVEEGYHLPENVVELLVKVNRMVKDKSCPNNYMNRFYKYKHTVIKRLILDGRVSEIYGEGNCYSMLIDGKHCVHQLRADFPEPLTVAGEREYIREETSEPFDKKTFDDFQLAAIYYIAKTNKKFNI